MTLFDFVETVSRDTCYNVIYDTYGGECASFPSTNVHLHNWLARYGNCEVARVQEQPNGYDFVTDVYLVGWNSGGALRE